MAPKTAEGGETSESLGAATEDADKSPEQSQSREATEPKAAENKPKKK